MSHRSRLEALADSVLSGKGHDAEPEQGDFGDGTGAMLHESGKLAGSHAEDIRMVGSLRGIDDSFTKGKYAGKATSRAQLKALAGEDSDSEGDEDAAARLEQLQAAALDLEGAASDSESDSDSADERAARQKLTAGVREAPQGAVDEVTDELTFLQQEEQSALRTMSRSASQHAARSRAAKAQVAIADSLLESRIHMQAAMAAAARLPVPGVLDAEDGQLSQLNKTAKGVSAAAAGASAAAAALLSDLLQLQQHILPRAAPVAAALASGHSVTSAQLAAHSQAPVQAASSEITVAAGEALTPPAQGKKRPRGDEDADWDADTTWAALTAGWEAAQPYMRAVHDAAHAKVSLGGGETSLKKLKKAKLSVLNAALSEQVDGVMSDPARVARQAHPSEYAPTLRAPLCLSEGGSGMGTAPDARGAATGSWRSEIYDDSDFYQGLLKDFVLQAAAADSGVAAGGPVSGLLANTAGRGISGAGGDVSAFKAGYKRVSRDVDRRASKGRRIRYVIHPKLTGFMAPEPLNPPPIPGTDGEHYQVDVDVLVRSLFQRS